MDRPKVVFHILQVNEDIIRKIRAVMAGRPHSILGLEPEDITGSETENVADVILIPLTPDRWQWLEQIVALAREACHLPMVLCAPGLDVPEGFHIISATQRLAVIAGLDGLNAHLDEILELGRRHHKTVLFVDDDSDILQAYRRSLYKAPWKILTATDGEEALKLLHQEPVDAVVTDVKMPKMHGLDLVSKIRVEFEKMPIIICSGYHGLKGDYTLEMNNIYDFIEKPVSPIRLQNLLREVLRPEQEC